ncbi:MAG: creatininase family protein, partial [bacterium]
LRRDDMRLDFMRPHQIRTAIAANLPVVLPIGGLEYHGEHLPVGVDLIAVTRVVERLEAEAPERMILLPPFAYGAASHAVSGPQSTGTLHVEASSFLTFAQNLFASLLNVGFRNIHGVVHHQTENFGQAMPTDLAFRLAARQAVFAHQTAMRGHVAWGKTEGGDTPFGWIAIHPLMPPDVEPHLPFDHAGEGETALMLALAHELVEPARMADNTVWFTDSAPRATTLQGVAGVAVILDHLRVLLGLAG